MKRKLTKTTEGLPAFGMTVESQSSSPYESGELEMRFTETKLLIRWKGETKFSELEWHEVAFCAMHSTPKLKEELQWLSEEAQREGFDLGFEMGSKENARKIQEARDGIRTGLGCYGRQR